MLSANASVSKGTATNAFASINGVTQVYTHAYKFNNWPGQAAIATSGVIFKNVGGAAATAWPVIANWDSRNETGGWKSTYLNSPADLSISPDKSTNAYSIIARNPDGSAPDNALERLFHGWIYNASGGSRTTTFTLSGLEAGREYALTLYYSLNLENTASLTFASAGTSTSAISLDGNATTAHADRNSVIYSYVAGSDGNVRFTFNESNGGFRLYALTNASLVPDPAIYNYTGNGSADTEGLQAVINQMRDGDTLNIYGNCTIATLKIFNLNNVTINVRGRVNTHFVYSDFPNGPISSESTSPMFAFQDCSMITMRSYDGGYIQNGFCEAIWLNRVDGADLSVDIDGLSLGTWNAIFVYNSSYVSIYDCYIKNGSEKCTERSAAGRLCDNKGNGIKVWHTKGILIERCVISGMRGNGIYIGSSADLDITDESPEHLHYKNVQILENRISDNGQSGVQINFNNPVSQTRDYTIKDNYIWNNWADGIDMNNTIEPYNVWGYVADNFLFHNGWIHGNEGSPDGSGVATCININKLKIHRNLAIDPYRTGLYIGNCGDLEAYENIISKSDKSVDFCAMSDYGSNLNIGWNDLYFKSNNYWWWGQFNYDFSYNSLGDKMFTYQSNVGWQKITLKSVHDASTNVAWRGNYVASNQRISVPGYTGIAPVPATAGMVLENMPRADTNRYRWTTSGTGAALDSDDYIVLLQQNTASGYKQIIVAWSYQSDPHAVNINLTDPGSRGFAIPSNPSATVICKDFAGTTLGVSSLVSNVHSFAITTTPQIFYVTSEDPGVSPAYDMWAAFHSLKSSDAAANADPDGDGMPNLLEYALGLDPLASDSAGAVTPGTIGDGDNERLALAFARIADPNLTYTVEATGNLAADVWEATFISSGNQNTSDSCIAADIELIANHPCRFLRLTVSTGATTVKDTPRGAMTYAAAANSTISVGVPLLRPFVLGSVVTAGDADSITLRQTTGQTLNLANLLDEDVPYYIEVIGHTSDPLAPLVGERFDINVAATRVLAVNQVKLDAALLHNSPPRSGGFAELQNYQVSIRPHWTLGSLLGHGTGADLNAAATAVNADQVQTWESGLLDTYYYRNTSPEHEWRRGVANRNHRVIAPGEGFLFTRRAGSWRKIILGDVRTNQFVLPLKTSGQFFAAAQPIDHSPASLGLTAENGFTASGSPANADQLLVWSGSLFSTHYLRTGNPPQWRRGTADHTNTQLFKASEAPLLMVQSSDLELIVPSLP